MKGLAFAVAAALLLLPSRAVLHAQEQEEGPGEEKAMKAPEHESMAAKWKEKLGLTDEQVDKLKAAMKARREAMEPLLKQAKESMQKLREQVKAKAADSEIQATMDAMEKVHGDMRGAMEKFKADVTSFLSPTQRAKMMMHMHHMMEKRMHGEGGQGMAPKKEAR